MAFFLAVLTGIQVIQFIITAKDLPETSKYLNLRLRMEQQRLFAWSETSGLLDLENAKDLEDFNASKIRGANAFIIHRTTILDLLMQVQCLFKEFEKAQRKNGRLRTDNEPVGSEDDFVNPAEDASKAHVPLPESRKKYIIKAMKVAKSNAMGALEEGRRRLLWASFDKVAFEDLLQRFSTLNDKMTDILDARLQTEIHRTTQDTNRGVLQLHKDIASLRRLVQALDIKMSVPRYPVAILPQYANNASSLQLLTQLAKFKAFNESIESQSTDHWDEAAAMALQLERPGLEKANTRIDRSRIKLTYPDVAAETAVRCEAICIKEDGTRQNVWIEWKEYEFGKDGSPSPPPEIIDRVQKLAALLRHSPKPEAFRVPHCLGYFDNARPSDSSEADSESEEDSTDARIGFVFEKPLGDGVSPDALPVSLFDLLSSRKPRVTDRIRLAHAIANCLLYLHSVNWLHKGLRSHNIVFFPIAGDEKGGRSTEIDWSKPYLSGFDFARPARADEMTEIPGHVPTYNLYRHPSTQAFGFGPRESFRKTFDIYSLGVILVELAHWRTVDKILDIEVNKTKLVAKIRDTLLEERRIADVGANMGEVFEEATRKCISGGRELGLEEADDETDDTVAAKLSMAFYEDVVKKLGDVRV
jgi:serine/threonine protein kinase